MSSARPRLTGKQKLRSLTIVSSLAAGFVVSLNIARGNEWFYDRILMPTVRRVLPPEFSHELAVFACKHRLFRTSAGAVHSDRLRTQFLGHSLANPLGIAAGFDKHGDALAGLRDIGFGFVEIGSITPEPQSGNARPRVFRLHEDAAIVNRYGFNSVGHREAFDRIASDRQTGDDRVPIGINLGKNKTSPDAAGDYVAGVRRFAPIADYLVINVSSPNTPGLRQLQHDQELQALLRPVIAARDAQAVAEQRRVPIALKLAPDLGPDELDGVLRVIARPDCAVDALIVSNTTVDRPATLRSASAGETGGLSGRPLRDRATRMVARCYRQTGGRVPIVGVGGVFDGRDAYAMIRAGASVVQIYTAFAWHGPPVVGRIQRELDVLLQADGFDSVAAAVGKDAASIE